MKKITKKNNKVDKRSKSQKNKKSKLKASKKSLTASSKKKKTAIPKPMKRAPNKITKEKMELIEKDLLNFDLSPEEMQQLLNYVSEPKTIFDNKKSELTHEDLWKLIPTHEPIVNSKQPKTTNLVVKHIRERHEHSPFVLNLQKMAQEKQEQALKKQFIEQRYRQITQSLKNYPSILNPKPNFHLTAKKSNPKHSLSPKISQKTKALTLTSADVQEQFTTSPLFRLPSSWAKPAMSFVVLCLLVILPIKGFTYVKDLTSSKDQILGNAEMAVEQLQKAGISILNSDLDSASSEFQNAKMNFQSAEQELTSINSFIGATLKIIPLGGKYYTDAERLTKAGQQIAQFGDELTMAYKKINNDRTSTLTDKIIELQNTIKTSLLPQIIEINQNLRPINESLIPETNRTLFNQARNNLEKLEQNLNEFESLSNSLLEILGHNNQRRYLILFQNNNELRATGGFIGSLAVVDIRNGQIEKIDIPGGGSYDYQGSLTKLVQSPEPLQLINSRWELQDANWFFDFPSSAKKIQWFFEDAAKTSVDGIIAINADLITKILLHTEPITLSQYGKTITADNFLQETQLAVEYEYDKQTNKPKQFIADLTPVLMEQIFNPEKTDLLGVITELQFGLKEKNIQLYFNNENIQAQAKQLGWAGEIKNPPLDYLAVVNTNIAGGKTDTHIQQIIDHTVQINPQGHVYGRVEITRQHNGDPSNIFSGVRNVNYLRLYVPQGAELLSAEGFNPPSLELFEIPEDYLTPDQTLLQMEKNKVIEPQSQTTIYQENGKTVFAGWTQTDPGQTSTIVITYELPFKFHFNNTNAFTELFGPKNSSQLYSIYYQKQSGAQNTTVNSKIILPENLQALWSYPNKIGDQHQAQFNLNRDALHGLIVSPK